MDNPSEIKEDSDSRRGSDDFSENRIIICPETANLVDSLVQQKKKDPRLIIYDISHHYYPPDIEVNQIGKVKEIYSLNPSFKFHDKTSLYEFLNEITHILKISYSILRMDGFLAVKVNGTIKAYVKQIIDSVFHQENFMNEVLINSPLKIHYSKKNAFFERTDYFLLYSTSKTRKINPVYDEKESGGYWHSFVSKGQGTPKYFLINGKKMLLDPPSGTHWKLRQESILELCEKGQIRLNRRGNPEYWVPPKIGQIVDSNWLDLDNSTLSKHQDSYYTRLFKVLMSSKQVVMVINPRTTSSLIEASNYNLNWICMIQDKQILDLIKYELSRENISYSVMFHRNFINSKIGLTKNPLSVDQTEFLPSSTSKSSTLVPISFYPNDRTIETQAKNLWNNRLIQGDCLEVLRLLKEEYYQAIKLIYIDPPFYTGYNESIYIPVQSISDSNLIEKKVTDNSIKTFAYKNLFLSNTPIDDFKTWFRRRVTLMRPLLRLDGFIFVRFDYHFGHYAKKILDDTFGQENFVIEFIIRRMKKNLSDKQLNRQSHLIVHSDSLFVYRGSNEAKFHHDLIKKSVRRGQNKAEIEYLHDNLWIDIAGYQKVKRTLYPTENSEALLKRVIDISTSEGDIVADFFAGSGTTLAMAEKSGRKWLGIDIGKLSISEIRKRILQVVDRSPFEFHRIIDENGNQDSEEEDIFNFDIKIEKHPLTQGNKIVLTLINMQYSSSMHELQNYSFIDIIDYWEIDWDYDKSVAAIDWCSNRQIKRKKIESSVTVSVHHEYSEFREFNIWVNIVDIFGNSSHKTIQIDLA
ncbi:MAG: DNA methyltransferase [Candidatus Hodarchaeales archaeon]|jgi:adenine specific DNA methylase Mod